MIPVTRKDWAERQRLVKGIPSHPWARSEKTIIRDNVTWLIERCYAPEPEIGAQVQRPHLRKLGLESLFGDAINWGDLHVCDVRRLGKDGWLVDIEEASPDATELQRYIAGWLRQWGWKVEVGTEW